jgi:ABC-type nitrate/sulfonate/bicarbonate transport system substrate-binding protein
LARRAIVLLSLVAVAGLSWAEGTAAPAAGAPPIPELPAGTTVPISTAWGVLSAVFSPTWIAYDRGYFRQFGLNVTMDHLEGVIQAQAIVAGKILFGNVGGAELLNARAAGSPMEAILQTTDSPVFELHAPPTIRSIGEFRDKTIAITRAGSTTDMAVRVILKNHGLVPGQDVKLLNMNEMSGIVAALQAGIVQGGVLSYPAAFQAAAAGFPKVASTVEEHVHLQQNLIVVMKPYADMHEAVVFAYLKGYLLGLRDFVVHPEVAHAAIAKYTNSDPAASRAAYEAVRPAMMVSHYVNEEGFKTVQEFGANPKVSQVRLADAHDDHFLRTLEASGFLKRLGLSVK